MYRHRSRELSLLARGQGMLDGGVEIECFTNDSRAFSLSGRPLIQSSSLQANLPYKAHKLNLPKTFVTKRGQMVLFTASEDMIIGKSCSFHQKEAVPQQAVSTLKTTSRLLDSALDFYPEDNFHLKHREGARHSIEREDLLTQPGHFTNVYLKSLQKASEATEVPTDCSVEDIEEGSTIADRDGDVLAPCNSDAPPMSECDSGLGQSTISRHSAQSRLSDGKPVIIPHGREDSDPLGTASRVVPPTDSDLLTSLRNELTEQKTASKSKKTSNKSGKKRQKLSSTAQAMTTTSLKTKSKKGSNSEQKSGKSKRKRAKKDTRGNKHDCLSSETDLNLLINETEGQSDELTAVNLTPGDPALSVEGLGHGKGRSEETLRRISRAEERRREVERKRAEKRELEAQKRREMEEKQRLEEELLAQAQKEEGPLSTHTLTENQLQPDNVSMASIESEVVAPETLAIDPTPNQARLRAELDRSRLSQHRWLLMNQGEKVEKELADEMDSAQEAIRLAKQAEEERQRLEELRLAEEKRRQEAEQQARLKEAARMKAAEILSNSAKTPSSDNQKRLDSELSKQRQERMFSNPSSIMFSYFKYVPPPKVKKEKTRGRGVKTKTVKAN